MRLRGSDRVRVRVMGSIRGRGGVRGRGRVRVRGRGRVRSSMGRRVMLLMWRSDGMKQMGELHPIIVCRVVDCTYVHAQVINTC